jgi:hypothetical protein
MLLVTILAARSVAVHFSLRPRAAMRLSVGCCGARLLAGRGVSVGTWRRTCRRGTESEPLSLQKIQTRAMRAGRSDPLRRSVIGRVLEEFEFRGGSGASAYKPRSGCGAFPEDRVHVRPRRS